jgi:hypothetical protein
VAVLVSLSLPFEALKILTCSVLCHATISNHYVVVILTGQYELMLDLEKGRSKMVREEEGNWCVKTRKENRGGRMFVFKLEKCEASYEFAILSLCRVSIVQKKWLNKYRPNGI